MSGHTRLSTDEHERVRERVPTQKMGCLKTCGCLASAFSDSSAAFQADDRAGVNGESGAAVNFSELCEPAIAGGVEDIDKT